MFKANLFVRDQAPGCTRVELLHGRWPGLTIDHVYPDWRSYSKLIFDLEVEGDRPIIVTIRVHDRQHARGDELYDDRYNREFRLEPGRNIIEIRIDEITTSPTDRTMDGNAIKSLAIFSTDDFAGLAFRLYEIRLN